MDNPDNSLSKSQCGHKELFNNPDLVTKFINLALIPLVSRSAQSVTILREALQKTISGNQPDFQ